MEIQVYIIDQNHPTQKANLPDGAVPGYVVNVHSKQTGKLLESFHTRWESQAHEMAKEYYRQYACQEVWQNTAKQLSKLHKK